MKYSRSKFKRLRNALTEWENKNPREQGVNKKKYVYPKLSQKEINKTLWKIQDDLKTLKRY